MSAIDLAEPVPTGSPLPDLAASREQLVFALTEAAEIDNRLHRCTDTR